MIFEAIRQRARAHRRRYRPRVVFTSSIAVFGAPFPERIGDEFFTTPLTSYGTQKAICELLLADYSRRGFFDGIGLRLPTICVRPGQAQQRRLRLLLQHHPRAAGRPRGRAAGLRGRAPLARLAALGGRLSAPCGDDGHARARRAPQSDHARRQRHRRRADRGLARASPARRAVRLIRREPDPAIEAHRRGLAAQLRRRARVAARLRRRGQFRGHHPQSHRRRTRRPAGMRRGC